MGKAYEKSLDIIFNEDIEIRKFRFNIWNPITGYRILEGFIVKVIKHYKPEEIFIYPLYIEKNKAIQ